MLSTSRSKRQRHLRQIVYTSITPTLFRWVLNKEHYHLIMVVDGIDFIRVSVSQDHSTPENMILEFLNMTSIKIGTIRFDGAKEFSKSVSFQNFCNECGIIMKSVAP
jgi:hypothetical protein